MQFSRSARVEARRRKSVAHHAGLWAAEDGLVALALEMLEQTRQRPGHAVDLWQEVLCTFVRHVSRDQPPDAGREMARAKDGPVTMATRSLA
jgi:hypothetical protein